MFEKDVEQLYSLFDRLQQLKEEISITRARRGTSGVKQAIHQQINSTLTTIAVLITRLESIAALKSILEKEGVI